MNTAVRAQTHSSSLLSTDVTELGQLQGLSLEGRGGLLALQRKVGTEDVLSGNPMAGRPELSLGGVRTSSCGAR